MSLIGKFVSKNRARKVARALSMDPSVRNYAALAREHVVAGNTDEVLRVCTEGLQIHPGNADLRRMADRARQLQLDQRARVLQEQLRLSPRPALWRELSDVLLESGRLDRALACAEEWYEKTKDGEALYFRARVHAEHFFSDRRSEDGRRAYDLAGKAVKYMAGDPRPLRLQFEITSRCGAWEESRRLLARLLELLPGDPTLEAHFRNVLAMCEASKDGSKTLEQNLQRVESTGRFVGDEPDTGHTDGRVAVRPMLQELSADSEVRAAVYLRGGTALVQGLRGATAERTARAVREVGQASRSAARRLGLGRPVEILLEGDFGSLVLSPGEQGASALWCIGSVKRKHEALLKDLSGMAGMAGRRGA